MGIPSKPKASIVFKNKNRRKSRRNAIVMPTTKKLVPIVNQNRVKNLKKKILPKECDVKKHLQNLTAQQTKIIKIINHRF